MSATCRILLTWTVLGTVMISGAAPASGRQAKDPEGKRSRVAPQVAVDVFVGRDRDVIRHYYRTLPGGLPPGLAKRQGELPPGLEKQLRRNGHLPPGLDKQVAPFPAELEQRLPPLKSGLLRGIIHGRAVIYSPKAGVVLDVFAVF